MAADVLGGTFDTYWLVPSPDLVANARQDRLGRYRFVASAKAAANDQWRIYRLSRAELPSRLLGRLGR